MTDTTMVVCTAEHPWDWANRPGVRVQHPDMVYLRDDYDTSMLHCDYEVYQCPHCGKKIYEELPN